MRTWRCRSVPHFEVTLAPAASGTVTVEYATHDVTARDGEDYTGQRGTLTFAADETSKMVSVPVTDDEVDDDGETLTLALTAARGAAVADATATGTIRDAEPAALPELSVADAEASEEDDAALSFAVTLAPAATGTVTVAYATSDGTATAGEDYTDTSDALEFAAGETSKTVSVPITDDSTEEADETLTLTLSSPAKATLGNATASGTIRDNDGTEAVVPTITAEGGSATEGETVAFTVTLSEETSAEVSVDYETATKGAASGVDFTRESGTLTFGADETSKTIEVETIEVEGHEGDETIELTLSNAINATLGTTETTATIEDDDDPPPTAAFQDVPNEHDGASLFTFEVLFSEKIPTSYKVLRDEGAFTVSGGTVRRARRVNGRDDRCPPGRYVDRRRRWPGGTPEGDRSGGDPFPHGLEGSRAYTLAGRLSLTPSVELGLRHDGGDAENGAGMDVGGGLVVADARTGPAVDVRMRMLVVHQAEGFRERGMALSLSYNPTPSTPLGFSARVAPSWDGQAQGGAEALWGRESIGGMAHGGFGQGSRLDGEVGYGLPVGAASSERRA